MGTDQGRSEPTAADVMAEADEQLPPGHPAASTPPVPSAGEQISRGGEELAVPGDDVVVRESSGDTDDT